MAAAAVGTEPWGHPQGCSAREKLEVSDQLTSAAASAVLTQPPMDGPGAN